MFSALLLFFFGFLAGDMLTDKFKAQNPVFVAGYLLFGIVAVIGKLLA